MIAEILSEGKDNTLTGRQIAAFFRCGIRDVTAQIEKERRAGRPICATSTGTNPGYFLAANGTELQKYCERLERREGELSKTRAALLGVVDQLPEEDQEENV